MALVEYSQQDLGSIVERIAGEDGIEAWIDDANDPEVGPEEGFPEGEDDEILWELVKPADDEDGGVAGVDGTSDHAICAM